MKISEFAFPRETFILSAKLPKKKSGKMRNRTLWSQISLSQFRAPGAGSHGLKSNSLGVGVRSDSRKNSKFESHVPRHNLHLTPIQNFAFPIAYTPMAEFMFSKPENPNCELQNCSAWPLPKVTHATP
jgi:hypothetical protein